MSEMKPGEVRSQAITLSSCGEFARLSWTRPCSSRGRGVLLIPVSAMGREASFLLPSPQRQP